MSILKTKNNMKIEKPISIIIRLDIFHWVVSLLVVTGIILFLVLCVNWKELKQQNSLIESKTVYKIVLNYETKIPYEDSLILMSLKEPLKEREGYSETLYQNPDDPHWYIGRGHQLKYKDFKDIFFKKCIQNVFCYRLTKEQIEILFWKDIKKAWVENERLKRKTLYKNCCNIFISGHR